MDVAGARAVAAVGAQVHDVSRPGTETAALVAVEGVPVALGGPGRTVGGARVSCTLPTPLPASQLQTPASRNYSLLVQTGRTFERPDVIVASGSTDARATFTPFPYSPD